MQTQVKPARILSVDDTPGNLYVIRELLSPLGYQVIDAASGEEALERAANEEFALFLLDVMMPGLDGLETLTRLRTSAKCPDTPAVLVTAGTRDARDIGRAYALGAFDYIEKPIAPEVLRGKVKALVTLYEVNRDLRARDAALAMKDRYIAILAHDLRNPLNTVLGASHILRRAEAPPAFRLAGERITRAVTRMDAMIRDLLDHARAGAGNLPMSPSANVDLGALARELTEEFEVADPARKIVLTVTGDVRGEWDAARLYQALSNLVGNATHYGRGSARLAVTDQGPFVEAAVTNDGPAISPELLPHLFQPFQRGNDGGSSSVGLGLYIVDAISRSNGGQVTVDSSAEHGTTFRLRLPRR
jgi:signal transduction histidine kinase